MPRPPGEKAEGPSSFIYTPFARGRNGEEVRMDLHFIFKPIR
jgi:hypothetical protein